MLMLAKSYEEIAPPLLITRSPAVLPDFCSTWFTLCSGPSCLKDHFHDRHRWVEILLYCDSRCDHAELGAYMTRVFNGERTLMSPILRPVDIATIK